VIAAAVVVVAMLVPDPRAGVESAYGLQDTPELTARIAALQTELARQPANGKAAEELGQLLEQVQHHDQALRIGGEASSHASPSQWRAFVAVWSAHADRLRYVVQDGDGAAEEIAAALDWANRAEAACRASPDCQDHELARLMLYRQPLQAGADWIARGNDPKRDPAGFRSVINKSHPTATLRGK
jgi:hypothetical protein